MNNIPQSPTVLQPIPQPIPQSIPQPIPQQVIIPPPGSWQRFGYAAKQCLTLNNDQLPISQHLDQFFTCIQKDSDKTTQTIAKNLNKSQMKFFHENDMCDVKTNVHDIITGQRIWDQQTTVQCLHSAANHVGKYHINDIKCILTNVKDTENDPQTIVNCLARKS